MEIKIKYLDFEQNKRIYDSALLTFEGVDGFGGIVGGF